MNNKYLVDLRHLIDLSRIKAYIEISNCIEFQHPTDVMDNLTRLLSYANKNSICMPKQIDTGIFNSLIKKVEANRDYLHELNEYIEDSSRKLKEDNGWEENDMSKVGIPRSSFGITLEELIVFYKVLENLENCYDIIKNDIVTFWSVETYFNNIKTIKNMLEKRLAHAIINVPAL
ncbi:MULTISPECIES: hypothetical protein [Clostridium]|uniref:Uncharacterized protein n=2 Tax=Clostridium TaxID=1485 RepID=D8GK25_CLOLD|nr:MULTISPECIES: hypothetical protein [Clostridium]ADK13143.1 hypothetical protein CLJU_c00360 [Clostridium ljungdahlii DSM 13528]AGY76366.1 hypothetical protein CAETHG_2153 [Clostridium autoethanogenum DSM 10061]ALU36529.1 Hypothetical protein CLAU_2100 [Clostridium autoethanogenum DSM 10061]OAA84381.1 hypothetical protein WX45_01044 [Clostridium ljungdahlii DSM 13528]OVY48615.1 hypothetical protein WX72_00436 [Clostridium autoethanogenum]